MAKISTTLYLEPAQVEALRARASRTGTPVAAIIRRAIDRELAPTNPLAKLAPELEGKWKAQLDVIARLAPDFFETLTKREALLVELAWGKQP